jgi:molybdenum cofactor cytidylyltransferase
MPRERDGERDAASDVVAVVPAAGASSRFGSSKLVATIDGETLLDRTLRSLFGGGVARVVVVVAADPAFEYVERLRDPRVRVVVNPEPWRGMFSSIRIGVEAALPASRVVILPADMPFVLTKTVSRILAEDARVDRILVARYRGRRGHPLVLPERVARAIVSSPGNRTLSDAIARLDEARVEFDTDDPGVLRDVDVPDDLSR